MSDRPTLGRGAHSYSQPMKPITRLAKWYLSLFPAYPAKYIERRTPLERARMEYESELADEDAFLRRYFPMDVTGLDILDLGCGFGGRTVRWKEMGARSVTGLEIGDRMAKEAAEFASSRNVEGNFLVGVGEHLPFPDDSFDAVFSYDVFEHVQHLPSVLSECFRVLRPGGSLRCALPPVHHPTGGTHFHGYVSRSPLPNVLFRPRTLYAAASEIMEERQQKVRPTLRPGQYLPDVNGTTIGQFKRYIAAVPFTEREVYLRPLRMPSSMRAVLSPLLAIGTRLPLVREVCTSRIIATLTK